MADDLPVLAFESPETWHEWLREHHGSSPGLWIKIAKKGSRLASIDYAQAVDEALCFGWIDGQMRSLDDTFYVQRFTPRAKRSMWSKRNRDKVAELTAAGRMQPAGLREIERAREDGRWNAAYDAPSTSTVPDDLQRELDRHADAAAFFAKLDRRNRYAILHHVQTAKKPETRARRIERFVAMLRAGEKLYP